ncbi:MAG: MFS transporter [Salinigranum sp.]
MADATPSTGGTTVAVVSGGHFLSHVYILALPPLFPLIQSEFGWGPTRLGLVVSVLALAGLLQPAVGGAVDRYGAKRLFVAGLVVSAVGLALIGVAPSYGAVLGFALLSGLGQTTFHPADYAMIGAVTTDATKGRSFSAHVLAGYMGFAVAPTLVGTLGLQFGWRTALIAVGALGPLYAVVAALVLEPVYLDSMADSERAESTDPTEPADRPSLATRLRVFLRPATVLLLLFFLMLTVSEKGIQTFTPLLVSDTFGLPEATSNLALTAYFAASSVAIVAGGVLADRLPPRYIAGAMLSLAAGVMVTIVTFGSYLTSASAVAVFACVGFCVGLVLPSRDRFVNAVAPSGSTGRTFGFVFAGISLGGVVGPATLGVIIDHAGAPPAFLVVAAGYVVAVTIVATLGSSRIGRRTDAATSGED